MTERAVTVQTGGVTPLGDNLPAGTSIFNLDPANGIWVSTNAGVTPGQGAKVGAYGSILWQGGPCYAVPDTGVAAPVKLTLSDQATNPVSPVDVGAAVAVRLGQTPLTLDTTTTTAIGSAVGSQSLKIGSGTVNVGNPVTAASIGTAVAGNPLKLDATTTNAIGSAVASQSLTVGNITGGNVDIINTSAIGNDVAVNVNAMGVPNVLTGDLICSANLVSPVTPSYTVPVSVAPYQNLTVILTCPGGGSPQVWEIVHYDSKTNTRLYSKKYVQAAATTSGIHLDIIPRGDQIIINWTTNVSPVTVGVYASNRAMPEGVINTDNYYYGGLANQAMGAFSTVTLPGFLTTPGGLHNVAIEIGGTNNTTAKGFLQAQYLDSGGAVRTLTLCGANVAGNGPAGETFFQGLVMFPAGVYQLLWIPGNAVTCSVNVFVTVPITA